jgi:outer membrane biosynthesis protein TonB
MTIASGLLSERMRTFRFPALAVTLFLYAATSFAATTANFYVDLLQKGIVQYNAASYPEAAALLRTAAFGLLEATDRYQLAQVYRAIVADKLNDQNNVRDAARRVIAAERIQRTYASLALPAAVRTSFEGVAKKALGASEVATLTSSAPAAVPATPHPTPPAPETKPETKPQPTPPATNNNVAPPEKKPAPQEAKPKPAPAKPAETQPKPTPPPTRDVAKEIAAADKALEGSNLNEAKRLYRAVLDATLTHEQAIRVAEGTYRTRDFPSVLRAFERAGALKRGEEPYRFYLAVAYYETGRIAAAKKELAAALNFIEVTPDVARYREKIEAESTRP